MSGETHSLFDDIDVEADELTIDLGDDVEMNADEFVRRFESVAEAGAHLETIAAELEWIRSIGLDDEDVRDLLYGRNHDLGKRDIEATFDAVDAIRTGSADRPLVRLVATNSGLTLSETEAILDELQGLARKYGDLNG